VHQTEQQDQHRTESDDVSPQMEVDLGYHQQVDQQ
jgi:hypothetical protein